MAESPEDIAADMHKRIRYGIRYADGTYETSPEMWEKRDANDIVVQTPEELYESNIGMCHDVTRALIKKLREKRIKHVAMMLTGDRMPNLPTHSFVVYDKKGKHTVLDPLSYATGSKGEYSSVREAVKDRIEDWKKEEEKGNIHSYRIPKKDWENRGLLDFLHFNGEKKAQAVDLNKWPDDFRKWQKEHDDEKVWQARKAVIDNLKNRGKWGLLTSKGKYLSANDEVDDEKNLDDVLIRDGSEAERVRRASCHELAAALLAKLRKNRINAHRLFFDKDKYNFVAMGHSTVFFEDDSGRWHRATSGMGARKKSRMGDFDSLEDAVDQYIAVEKANRQTTDDERVDVYDTTDLPFRDRMPWPEYKALARTGKRLYHQEGK